MSDCLFCKIKSGDIPSNKVFENDNIYAFEDINPQAKTHLLFIHKNHTTDIFKMMENNPKELSDIFGAIHEYVKEINLEKEGYRIVTNCGEKAGQSVFHTHFHLLSDNKLRSFGS